MTIEEIQVNYIIEPNGDWRQELTKDEIQVVREMDNGRVGELLKELQHIIQKRKEAKSYDKCCN